MFLIECKRWARDRPVGVEVVRSLYGVVSEEKATCGVIATTSRFTSGAEEFAGRVQYQMSLRGFDSLRLWLSGYQGSLIKRLMARGQRCLTGHKIKAKFSPLA